MYFLSSPHIPYLDIEFHIFSFLEFFVGFSSDILLLLSLPFSPSVTHCSIINHVRDTSLTYHFSKKLFSRPEKGEKLFLLLLPFLPLLSVFCSFSPTIIHVQGFFSLHIGKQGSPDQLFSWHFYETPTD